MPARLPGRRLTRRTAGVLAGALVASVAIAGLPPAAEAVTVPMNLTGYVDPFIGTDPTTVTNPVPGGGSGRTLPGPTVPFGMMQLSPDTPTSPSGYMHQDSSISQFSLTHYSGAGCRNNQDVQILPIAGALPSAEPPGKSWDWYGANYTKTNESAEPGYYRTDMVDSKGTTGVELTTTQRSAIMRIKYPARTDARVLLNVGRNSTAPDGRYGTISISGRTVTGMVTGSGFCDSNMTYQVYYRIEFDRDPTRVGTWLGDQVPTSAPAVSGVKSGGYLTFDTTTNPYVQMKVSISFVDQAGADANLAAEQPGFAFDTVRAAAHDTWNKMLNRIQVRGGATADLRKFYTALYHVLVEPSLATDATGQYRGFDNQIHTAASSRQVYQNFSGWDIYRSWAALIALVAPVQASDIAQSMVLAGQQGGLLPKWAQYYNETNQMVGDPGPIIVSSMYAFGARGFDTAAALSLMDKSSNGGTMQNILIRGDQASYVQHQYIPGKAATTLEYNASDFAIAQFARALGDTTMHDRYIQRAQWWRNLFNPATGFLEPRNADGTWPATFDPTAGTGYAEGDAYQYTWMVPFNYGGLIDLMGGPATAGARLDQHFQQLNGGTNSPYFYIGNEPEHSSPWIYDYAGAPAKTSAVVRRAVNDTFNDSSGGLPGNDDLGAMSAWFVWAALGMYPASPGSDVLTLHGPLFPSILIDRAVGDLQITAPNAGPGNQYVQGLSVNGTPSTHPWLRYSDVHAEAGVPENTVTDTLTFTMGADPNSSWGTAPTDAPPSFGDGT